MALSVSTYREQRAGNRDEISIASRIVVTSSLCFSVLRAADLGHHVSRLDFVSNLHLPGRDVTLLHGGGQGGHGQHEVIGD